MVIKPGIQYKIIFQPVRAGKSKKNWDANR